MSENKRRGIIKNIIIIFLVIMLVLTLFSNTIMNRSLPEVSVSTSSGGSITSQIKLNGAVSANQTKRITLEKARIIDSVMVRRGDMVERGTVLATLVKGESNDIYDLEIELQRLEIEYKQMLLKEGDTLVAQRRIIEDSEKELFEIQEYIDKYPELDGAVKGFEAEITVHENDIEKIEEEIEALEDSQKALKKQQENYSSGGYSTLKELNAAIKAKKKAIDQLEDATSDAKSNRSAALKAKSAASSALTAYKEAAAEKTELEEAIETVEESIADKKDLFDTAKSEYDSLYATLTPENSAEVQPRLDELDAEMDTLDTEISELENALSDKEEALEEVKETLSGMDTLESLEADYAAKSSAYNAADRAYENAQDAEAIAEEELDEMSDSGFEYFLLQDRIDEYSDQIEAKGEEKEDIAELLEEAKEKLADAEKDIEKSIDECEAEKLQLTRAIEDAKAAIELAESNGAIEDETAALNLSIKKREIDRKKKQINDLKSATAETEIVSPVSGTVSTVGIVAGDEVAADTVAFEITMTDMGYTMECSVTNSQAARLRVGQEAEVQYYYWGDKPSVRISQIVSDPNSGGKNKLVTFTVEGDVSDGTSLSLVVGSEGQSYDTIVPNSAVREDANGKFILKVISKSSPLGNRYYAERVDVEVLASDATKSAIDATLGWGDYVITGASVPISEGMQVRMAE